jgi:hypothetical protein
MARMEGQRMTIDGRVSGGPFGVARGLSAGVTAGFLGGLVFGGLGGRLAMLILRLTSDANLHGLETDDGFTIGIVSGATFFLVVVTAVAGAFGGLLYLIVRPWLPGPARPWLFGAMTGVLGGALVIRPGGIDFTRLEPLGLAIAMFVALPAAYGVVVSLLAERFLSPGSAFRRSRASIAGLVVLLPVPLFGIGGLAIAAVLIAALLFWRSAPTIASAWSSVPMTWVGRAALTAVGVAGAIALGRDVIAIL